MPWFRGCTHLHSNRSDGDSSPLETVAWYKRAGYDFVALTDHDMLTTFSAEERTELEDGSFLLIPGEELTCPHKTHINGLGLSQAVEAPKEASAAECLRVAVDRIRAAGGVPVINHPNCEWAFGDREMLAAKGWNLFEVFNAHPSCNSFGDAWYRWHPPVEAYWDRLLSAGRRVFGVASDDTHQIKTWGGHVANPAKGWVMANAPELSVAAILKALSNGDFHASTGVFFTRVKADSETLRVAVKQPATLHFIGRLGERLLTVPDATEAVYRFRGDEEYVRCRAEGKAGILGWTQPHFLDEKH